MTDLDGIRDLVRYDRAVFDRFERRIQRWGWAEATKNRETGHLSLKNTLVHILNVHEAWRVAIPQKRWEVFEEAGRRPNDVTSWREYRRYRDRVTERIDETLGTLTEKRLQQKVHAPWMPGRYSMADGFVQSSYEQAHHLGEIIAMFWQADREPPAMTWIQNGRQGPRRR